MKLYWPNALYKEKNGEIERLYTYDAALSMDMAKRTIDGWRDGYKYDIVKSWIDVYEDNELYATIDILVSK